MYSHFSQLLNLLFIDDYSVVPIKQAGDNKRTGEGAEFFHLLHKKEAQGEHFFIS